MTSKLKCPFCGEEIVGVPNLAQTRTIGFRCYNIQCKAFNHFMPVFILQALIQAKQDLKIATKALKELIAYYDHYDSFDGEISWDGVALIMRNDAHEALGQIEHKE